MAIESIYKLTELKGTGEISIDTVNEITEVIVSSIKVLSSEVTIRNSYDEDGCVSFCCMHKLGNALID